MPVLALVILQRGTLYVTIKVAFPSGPIPECEHGTLIGLLGQESAQTVYNGHEARFVPRSR
jgi:hypothetical protein